ncbi:hypothetical protein [Flavicella sp.]|uniref:hypothetical protein n=1 Tax=Flavicella sp. TaxID=2957742 RepID=UPI0030189602
MEPKNIERLFQEKLKDLEITPDSAVWNTIETSLNQKKQKGKYFIWFRFAGIAAVALLGFFIYNNYNVSNIEKILEDNSITNTTPILKENIKETDLEKLVRKTIIESNPNLIVNSPTVQKEKITQQKTTQKTASTPIIAVVPTKSESSIDHKKFDITQSKSIFNEISESKQAVLANKNTAQIKKAKTTAPKDKLDLADVLKEKEEEKELKKYSWAIAPTVSQLFSSTLAGNSSIDASLDQATKKGNNSTSYGVRIAYQASKKWQFQTGIHQLNLKQTTEDILFISNSSSDLFGISYSDKPSITDAVANDSFIGFKTDNSEGSINQTYGYIEIPFEAKYGLFHTNIFSFHLIGGVSTLFLTTNNLQIETRNTSYSAGEATNLNPINFTLNFGSNAEYHFNKKWYFDISPMIKFQTNTFDTNTNKPYFFGMYTGINYKF